MKSVMATSAQKLKDVKSNVAGIIDSALQLMKSYSQKKQVMRRRQALLGHNPQEIDYHFGNQNQREDRGCGSFRLDEDLHRQYLEEMDHFCKQIDEAQSEVVKFSPKHSTVSDDSLLLDWVHQN
jgi:hypothetical protein